MMWSILTLGLIASASLLALVLAKDVTDDLLNNQNESVRLSYQHFDKLKTWERNIINSDNALKSHRPEAKQLALAAPTPEISKKGFNALVAGLASTYISRYHTERGSCLYHGDEACARYISGLSLSNTTLGPLCAAEHEANCESTGKYRSVDGSCNNLASPAQGKSGTAYARFLFSDYYLGIDNMQPLGPRSKGEIPSPRVVSNEISAPSGEEESNATLALAVWAQFVANDIAFTTSLEMATEKAGIKCCNQYGSILIPRFRHDFCAPISIPQNDPVYSTSYTTCMNYVRSMPAFNRNCSFGPVQQLNQATHYLDGSMIYGSSGEEADRLRTLSAGLLRTNQATRSETLPVANTDYYDECRRTCLLSGDNRVNEHPQLAALHTIFVREHNRLARKLARTTALSDEEVYQEAKRLVVAEIQRISYREFVPGLLGEKLAKEINEGGYDPSVSAEVNNEVAVAVLRFFISLLQQDIKVLDNAREVTKVLRLGENFFNPRVVDESIILDGLLLGLATQPSQKMDLGVVPDLTSKYLATPGNLGLDLLSLDIQRGRDHGFPGYNKYRAHCGLPSANSFDDLTNIEPKNLEKLKAVYEKVDNIDLLVGGLAEKRVNGLLGETFSCLLADQLKRTRQGDRFFYENSRQPHPLSCAELAQVRSSSLAFLICKNGDNIASIQPNVFRKPGPGNEIRACSEILAAHVDNC